MMHGAAIVVLHISPLAVIVLPQQDDCGPGTGRGISLSEERAFTNVCLWLRYIVYGNE